jgi:uncharacterized protein (DUF2235 family)
MAKNIILCSDGTGNKGGYGADTNVFNFYNAIEIHDKNNEQVTFYDNGVGTNKNKIFRILGGAFGCGFEDNVKDLYEFLVRNYALGDQVYMLGFSRGAATIRAFAGMIEECGLLDKTHESCCIDEQLDEEKLHIQLDKAIKAYRTNKKKPETSCLFKEQMAIEHELYAPEGNLGIKFIGVWDTVSALGFPKEWSKGIEYLFTTLDCLSDYVLPHNYYNYQLNKNVENVYHAIAIDDERKTFHPKVWNENVVNRPEYIEQVWFSGVHSNVGGGYPRSGMAFVTLDWMMTRAHKHGLIFKTGALIETHDKANVFEKLYDSRDGVALYYRYAPRDIEALCLRKNENNVTEKRLQGPVKIHNSVIKRLKYGTARYAPGFLPKEFEIISTDLTVPNRPCKINHTNKTNIKRVVDRRKWLYTIFAESTFFIFLASWWYWLCKPAYIAPANPKSAENVFTHFADVLNYITPTFFDGFITYTVLINPYMLISIIIFFVTLLITRKMLLKKTQRECEVLRAEILKSL